MRGIIKFFLENTIAANLLMVFLMIMGLFGVLQMKTTFFPEVTPRNIMIQLIFPGASPEEMEEGVVTKIEENLVGVTGVKEVTSTSSENAASVIVEAERGFNTDIVLQDVKNAVDQISSFPRQLEPPIIYKMENYSPSYIFSLSGDMDLRTLKGYARSVEDDLLAINGISKVELSGFPNEEIEISFREPDMRALNITFDEAVKAISEANILTTGGTIKTSTEDLLIRAKNKQYYAKDMMGIVLRSNPNGGIIKLSQIADIKDQWEDNPTRNYVNKEPSVSVTVFNTTEEDMFSNSNATVTYLESFKQKYPHVAVKKIQDGKEYLNGRISFLKTNGTLGFIIVLILLALFLNIRMAFWVALAIPISFAGMFICAAYFGVTINVISTFGMIIVIGILVDDGIVIAENIFQHYERGATPMQAALDGTMEVLPAVTSAILTTVIAFSTFFFVDGSLGDVFPQLAIVVIFALTFSLIEGALILPAHLAHSSALKETSNPNFIEKFLNRVTSYFDRMMNWMKDNLYGPVLKLSMKFAFPTIALCIAGFLLVIGAFMGGIIKGTFFPNVQSDTFNIDVEMPPGTRENAVEGVLDLIEAAALEVNEELENEFFGGDGNVIEIIQKKIGPTTYEGQLSFYLMEGELRSGVSNRLITSRIRKKLGTIPGVEKLIFGLGNIFGSPVSISLIGTNPAELEQAVDDLKSELTKIEDLTDIADSNKEGLKEIVIELTPKAENLGFTLSQVMRYVRQGFFGAEIQRLQRGSDEVKVWVRYAEQDRSSLYDLSTMRIRSTNGQSIPLADLVTFRTERGVIAIKHINGQREIRISADVANDDVSISDINSDIESIILPAVLANYPSVRVGIQGQAKETAETQASMQKVMPLIGLCMFFVIVLTFSSVSQALIVFMLIPFGFIGVGFGHWLMDSPISMLSGMGMIALIGILVNDALVFISFFNSKIKSGTSFNDALYETGLSRFRPITLTTITTVAGLMPILLEKSVQAQFLIPMAISVAFGLMITTVILLIMIPALMVISNRIKLTTTQLWTGKKYTAAQVEPSYPGREHPWILTLLLAIGVLLALGALVQFSLFIAGTIS